ncbi:MAG: sugar ABC transporter ATP-binding protein [Rubrobacteraceae bacterium]
MIRQLREEGVGVIYVSHRLAEIYEICDRVTVMRDGQVVQTSEVVDISRLQLIAAMLRRNLTEAERGATSFGEDHDVEGEAVLEAAGLTRLHVLDDVSLNVRPGEVVGLAGLLGAGRSETARAIFGAQPLDSGTVKVGGKKMKTGSPSAAIKAGVAFLPEDRKAEGIIPNLSVRENIVSAALPSITRAGIVSEKAQDKIVREFMEKLGIKASSPEQKARELSGGNQQKVLLARWLCLNPRVLILDEPTRGIDVGAKAEVQQLIDELAEDGLGVIMISSDLEEVVEGSDWLIVLREGAVAGELSGEGLTENKVMSLIAEDRPEESTNE